MYLAGAVGALASLGLAVAMQRYGVIVADNGSDLYVTGTYDTRWDNDVLNPAFRSLDASDFEVVELGWEPEKDLETMIADAWAWRQARPDGYGSSNGAS